MITSLYQTDTVTCHVKETSIDHTRKVWLSEPIGLDKYDGIILSSKIAHVFTNYSLYSESYEDNLVDFWNSVSCYAVVTGGDWVEVTDRGEIPGLTAGMNTIGKKLQFKIEHDKNYRCNGLLDPAIEWEITTT